MSFYPVEKQSVDIIQAFQLERLKLLLGYLKENSPYYKNVFKAAPEMEVNSIKDLTILPTTTKQQFAEYNWDFLCVERNRIVDFCTTSGTTGAPVTVALTAADLKRLAYNEAQGFLTAGCSSDDVFQLMLALDRQFMAGMAYYLGAMELDAGIVRSGAVSPQQQWDNIYRFKPTVLVAVPSFLLKMIEYAAANNIDVNTSSVKRVICIGEPIREADLTPNVLAQRINAAWNVALISTYASTEMQTAFTECEHGHGNHLRPELIIAEVLDDEGNQLPAGVVGELTITTLGVQGMPLLRYRTGDMVQYFNEPCSCGRNTMRLSPVVGRKNQMIKYKGTTIFPAAIFDALNTVPEVKDYIVEIAKNELGTDDVRIHLHLSNGADEAIKTVAATLQAKLRVLPELIPADVQYFQSVRNPDNRKPVKVIFK